MVREVKPKRALTPSIVVLVNVGTYIYIVSMVDLMYLRILFTEGGEEGAFQENLRV